MDELIKFTPGQRPAHIGPDELVEYRPKLMGGKWFAPWFAPKPAGDCLWSAVYDYRLAVPPLTDDQLEAQCKARGWTVTKPLVTQAERDRLADALEASDWIEAAKSVRIGTSDKYVRAFTDSFLGAK